MMIRLSLSRALRTSSSLNTLSSLGTFRCLALALVSLVCDCYRANEKVSETFHHNFASLFKHLNPLAFFG
jgi:hypothetical protein